MAERDRDDDAKQRETSSNADADRLPDYPGGYDETVRRGPPLDSDVAQGDYRPGRYWLAGAAVRGYGNAGGHWGSGAYDRQGGGYGGERGGPGAFENYGRNMQGSAAPSAGPPAGFGAHGGWGRMGGWRHGDMGTQRRRGPKGYKRSDDRIREDICEHLMDIGDIDASDVEVHVRDATVVLEGTVPERRQKFDIEDIAAATLGVTDVENHLRVPRRDEEVAR
jgi:BON domain